MAEQLHAALRRVYARDAARGLCDTGEVCKARHVADALGKADTHASRARMHTISSPPPLASLTRPRTSIANLFRSCTPSTHSLHCTSCRHRPHLHSEIILIFQKKSIVHQLYVCVYLCVCVSTHRV
jgi:hypothetical protein